MNPATTLRRDPSLADSAFHAARLERRKGLRIYRQCGLTDDGRKRAGHCFRTAQSYETLAATSAAPGITLQTSNR